jgi:hypothetical protein
LVLISVSASNSILDERNVDICNRFVAAPIWRYDYVNVQRAKSAESVANPLHFDGWTAFRPLLSNVPKVSLSSDVHVILGPALFLSVNRQYSTPPRYLWRALDIRE